MNSTCIPNLSQEPLHLQYVTRVAFAYNQLVTMEPSYVRTGAVGRRERLSSLAPLGCALLSTPFSPRLTRGYSLVTGIALLLSIFSAFLCVNMSIDWIRTSRGGGSPSPTEEFKADKC